MNRTIFGAMVVVLSACTPGMNGAWAGETTEMAEHFDAGCSQSNRVTHSLSTCLHARWNNSERRSQRDLYIENTCPSYGSIVAAIEMPNDFKHWHMQKRSSGRSTGSSGHREQPTNDVYCCTDVSDLCYRQEVEAIDGVIKRHTSGTSYVDASVATHDERWLFCQDYPDAIYCEVDPEGDAKTEPPAFPDPNLQDCYDNWAASPAASSCTDFRAETSERRRSESAVERMRLALPDSACHDAFARCGREGFHIGAVERDDGYGYVHEPVPVADMATAQWCSGVSYRHCNWNAHDHEYEAEELTTRGSGMLGGVCPGPFTEWGWGGPYTPGVADGTHDCDRPPSLE